MSEHFELPNQGVVFWPIGTGDSTTIMVDEDTAVQVDLRHTAKSEEDDTGEWFIIDELVKTLPQRNDRPFLSVFALTHPDQDHIQGFGELLKQVDIGELWHTPRVFRHFEENETLCDDAVTFRNEAERRRKAIVKDPDNIKSGDRLLIIGHDDILKEDKYAALPDSCKMTPGKDTSLLNGEDYAGSFVAFIHAPFSDDQAKDRNNTSLAMQVVLSSGSTKLEALLLGDREYPTIKRIFETTEEHENEEYLFWDILLAPHHCSKCVMYFKGEDEEDATFKKGIMDYFEKYAKDDASIVASAKSEFTDKKGDNPPHQKAREKYEEIIDSGKFLCTHEHPDKDDPKPMVFKLEDSGIGYPSSDKKGSASEAVTAATAGARGKPEPPPEQVGFGC
ncbi:MAG: hypothetical protein U5L00_02670 [Desulfovermiculus sp.]|nr:hypothetical protein [Desulfovermiculus sp.]